MIVKQVKMVNDQRKIVDAELDALLLLCPAEECETGTVPRFSDSQKILSCVGIGRKVAATLIGEAFHALTDRNLDALRIACGTAPVTKRSGKSLNLVVMRRACNYQLRNAIHYWANAAVRFDRKYKEKYAAMRKRGLTHSRSLRSIGDALLRMLVAVLKGQELYVRECF